MYKSEQIISGDSERHLFKKAGNTGDIISAVMSADTVGTIQVREFAKKMDAGNAPETCYNLYTWVHDSIPFVEDDGKQDIQLPGEVYNNRSIELGGTGKGADCKSMSLFCSCVLRCMANFYEFQYRFISETEPNPVHHVYLIVYFDDNGNRCYIPLDCTLPEFGTETDFVKKIDKDPTIPLDTPHVGEFNFFKIGSKAGIGVFQPVPAHEDGATPHNEYPDQGLPSDIQASLDLLHEGQEARFHALWQKGDDSYWQLQTSEMKQHFTDRVAALKKQCQQDIFDRYAKSEPIKYSILQDKFRKIYDSLIDFGSVLIYYFWNDKFLVSYGACRGVGATEFADINFPSQYASKRQTSIDFVQGLNLFGLGMDALVELANLGVYRKYGVPLDYMLYRCYCIELYGQPFAPHANVPYWDNRTATLINNNPYDLGIAFNLVVCFPSQGGIGRPYGEPYWSTGGHIINNGATPEIVKAWVTLNPRPGTILNGVPVPGVIQNNGAGIPFENQLSALVIYNKWRKGNLVMLPQPIYNPDVAEVNGPRVGELIALITGLITAIVAVISIIVSVLKEVGVFDKSMPNASMIPLPLTDFHWDYQTADGCIIGHCNQAGGCNGAEIVKMCNGHIVEVNPNINDPKNQPPDPGGFFGGPAGKKKMLMAGGGALMIGGGLLLLND